MEESKEVLVSEPSQEIILADAPRCKDGSTIENLIMQFVTDKFARSQSQKTAKAYYDTITAFRLHLRNNSLDLVMYSITGNYDAIRVQIAEASKVFALSSKRKDAPVSGATRNLRLSVLASFYAFAELTMKIPFTSPLLLVKRSKVDAYAGAKAFQPQEVKEHLQAIETDTALGKRDYSLLHILFNTGRRVQDVLSLTWKNVRVSKGGIVTLGFEHMKGGKKRSMTLDKRVSDLLLAYLHEVYGSALGSLDQSSPIWVNMSTLPGNAKQKELEANKSGSALNYQAVRNICIKHLGEGKVHITRHSHVRLLQEAGANIEEIQEAIDHSNIATTQIYAKHFKRDANKYTEQVATLLGL